MKTIHILAACAALALASCSTVTPPEWTSPNPLDTPGTDDYRLPPSMGNFGPGWLDR